MERVSDGITVQATSEQVCAEIAFDRML